ncbi:hypothetical protein J6590_032606 [Homalodisca vitripennis]|nr:hypothetical protein J6590_032606 [Homalodisca vitripennis]
MAHRHIDRSSEIDRLLLRDSESESDDADPNFEIYSDHDTESEFDLDEVCEAGQHEEEIDNEAGQQREDNTDDQVCEESRDININLPGPLQRVILIQYNDEGNQNLWGKIKKQNG